MPKIKISKRRQRKDDPDQRIVVAVLALPDDMKNASGVLVTLPSGRKREETAAHIAARRHRFRVVDIQEFPRIIGDRKSVVADSRSRHNGNYVGRRPGNVDDAEHAIRIVTRKKTGYEIIVTAYPVKKV